MKPKIYTRLDGVVYAKVSIDNEYNCIMDIWEGPFGSQENFRNVLKDIGDLIVKKGITRWLADLRNLQGSFDSSSDFLLEEIMPRVIRSGLLREAVVLPKDIFSKLSATDAIKRLNNFEIRQFDDLEKAKEWLYN